ncbi:MAG: alpha/beta fold hydrolase [Planctomycetes bacterium]|nr:alpha/beta fold hydrolase [Planctomycetota bacterium]
MLAASLGWVLGLLLAGEEVELKAEDGVKIAAAYSKPDGAGKHPALLLVHEVGGQKENWGEFPAAAVKGGYAVLAIDMRGHGKSDNPFAGDRVKKMPGKWGKDEWMDVLKDLKAAKGYLAGRPEVDEKKIVLIGASIGANLALHFAAEDRAIHAVAALSPGENYKGVGTGEAMEACGDRPFFAAASEEDGYAAGSMRRLMAKAKHGIKNSRLYKGAGHGTKMFGKEDEPGDLTRELLHWLQAATR